MPRRRVYFAFDPEQDLHRVLQIREQLVGGDFEPAGFFDLADYVLVALEPKAAIRRVVRERVAESSVTIVLIGTETSSRPFVHIGIEESLANRNGFLGIHVHGIDDEQGRFGAHGPPPILPAEIAFPCSIWDWDLGSLQAEIEAAGRRCDRWRQG